jgi:O-antigen/teichoic acid export membrane protein
MDNISSKMAKGAAWMVAFKMLERSIGLVSTIVLARLLEPGDFGLVAMATAFLGLLLLLTSFSFDVALIQKRDAGRHLYDTAWTFNVIFGLVLALVLMIAAIPLAQFYNESRLENILYVSALSTLLGGFGNIGPVAFRKDMQFHKEFYFLLAKKIMGFTVCMILAFTLRNYWALVWGAFAGSVFGLILSYWVHPYRPRFCLSGRRELFGFSMWLFLNNIIFFIHNRIADFIISKLIGSHALGVYSIAYELSNLPTTELVAPINRAVLPGYSKIAGDPLAIRQGFLNVLSVIALCAVPAGSGIALVADSMVIVVLGEKWREVIPLIQILAVSGVIGALQTNVGSVYMVLGKVRFITIIAFFHTLFLFLPLLIVFLQHNGVMGVAKAYLYSNLIVWPLNYFVVLRLVKIRLLSILAIFWRPFLACGFMIFAVMYGKEIAYFYQIDSEKILLFVEIFIGAITYGTSILLLWWVSRCPDGAERFILSKLTLYFTR